jgi:hypothetical protein
VICENNHFQVIIGGETAVVVPRTTSEIHRYKANTSQHSLAGPYQAGRLTSVPDSGRQGRIRADAPSDSSYSEQARLVPRPVPHQLAAARPCHWPGGEPAGRGPGGGGIAAPQAPLAAGTTRGHGPNLDRQRPAAPFCYFSGRRP